MWGMENFVAEPASLFVNEKIINDYGGSLEGSRSINKDMHNVTEAVSFTPHLLLSNDQKRTNS